MMVIDKVEMFHTLLCNMLSLRFGVLTPYIFIVLI